MGNSKKRRITRQQLADRLRQFHTRARDAVRRWCGGLPAGEWNFPICAVRYAATKWCRASAWLTPIRNSPTIFLPVPDAECPISPKGILRSTDALLFDTRSKAARRAVLVENVPSARKVCCRRQHRQDYRLHLTRTPSRKIAGLEISVENDLLISARRSANATRAMYTATANGIARAIRQRKTGVT